MELDEHNFGAHFQRKFSAFDTDFSQIFGSMRNKKENAAFLCHRTDFHNLGGNEIASDCHTKLKLVYLYDEKPIERFGLNYQNECVQ